MTVKTQNNKGRKQRRQGIGKNPNSPEIPGQEVHPFHITLSPFLPPTPSSASWEDRLTFGDNALHTDQVAQELAGQRPRCHMFVSKAAKKKKINK